MKGKPGKQAEMQIAFEILFRENTEKMWQETRHIVDH